MTGGNVSGILNSTPHGRLVMGIHVDLGVHDTLRKKKLKHIAGDLVSRRAKT
jgi:hypothetical protein